MLQRFKGALAKARAASRGLRKDEEGVVMVEWVALAGVFVAILVGTFLLIGDKANTVVTAVDTQLETITTDANFPGTGTGTT